MIQELKEINDECLKIIYDQDNKQSKTISSTLLMNSKLIKNKENIINTILEDKNLNIEEIYNIAVYYIRFLDNKINKNQSIKLMNLILDSNNFYELNNCESPLISICKSNNINEEIINKTLGKFEDNEYFSFYEKHIGPFPYDNRYELIKNKSITKNIKKQIFKQYDDCELSDVINQLYFDITLNLNEKEKELFEFKAYEILFDELNNKELLDKILMYIEYTNELELREEKILNKK